MKPKWREKWIEEGDEEDEQDGDHEKQEKAGLNKWLSYFTPLVSC